MVCMLNTNGLYAQYKWFVCSIQTFVYPIQMVCMLNTNGLYAQYKLLYIQYKPFCMLNMNFCISNTNRFVYLIQMVCMPNTNFWIPNPTCFASCFLYSTKYLWN